MQITKQGAYQFIFPVAKQPCDPEDLSLSQHKAYSLHTAVHYQILYLQQCPANFVFLVYLLVQHIFSDHHPCEIRLVYFCTVRLCYASGSNILTVPQYGIAVTEIHDFPELVRNKYDCDIMVLRKAAYNAENIVYLFLRQ